MLALLSLTGSTELHIQTPAEHRLTSAGGELHATLVFKGVRILSRQTTGPPDRPPVMLSPLQTADTWRALVVNSLVFCYEQG